MTRLALQAAVCALVCACACGGLQSAPSAEVALADMEALQSAVHAPRQRALLVVFWATWCEPCVAEIPALVALHASSGEHLEIIGVSLDALLHEDDKSVQLVRAQLETTPTPYPHFVYTGRQDPLFSFFNMPGGIPYAILFDRDGEALQRFSGQVEPAGVRSALGLPQLDS